jgi:polysaccharide biosynthesis protein VpsM
MSTPPARTVWLVMLLLLAVAGYARPVAAQGNLELGPFRILPSLELALEYDDNILLTPEDEIDDLIWTISPGVVIELPSSRYAIRLGYRADILRYMDNTDLDTVHHSALFDVRVNFPGGLGLRLSDRFLITDDFAGFAVPELTERVERYENTLDVGADYTLRERFTLDVGYRWFLVDYQDEPEFDQFDREDHTIAGILFYRFMPKTSVLGEVDYNLVRYDIPAVAADRDSDAWRFKLGLKGDLTAKTTATIKIGWEWRDYDNPGREDWDGLVAEGEITWKYREPSEVRLYGGRANVESLDDPFDYYISSYAGVEVRHFLRERLILRVRALGGVNDYPDEETVGTQTAERNDTFFEAGASLRYQIRKWLAVEVGYSFLILDSNFDQFDYQANRVKGSVILTY